MAISNDETLIISLKALSKGIKIDADSANACIMEAAIRIGELMETVERLNKKIIDIRRENKLD